MSEYGWRPGNAEAQDGQADDDNGQWNSNKIEKKTIDRDSAKDKGNKGYGANLSGKGDGKHIDTPTTKAALT